MEEHENINEEMFVARLKENVDICWVEGRPFCRKCFENGKTRTIMTEKKLGKEYVCPDCDHIGKTPRPKKK